MGGSAFKRGKVDADALGFLSSLPQRMSCINMPGSALSSTQAAGDEMTTGCGVPGPGRVTDILWGPTMRCLAF